MRHIFSAKEVGDTTMYPLGEYGVIIPDKHFGTNLIQVDPSHNVYRCSIAINQKDVCMDNTFTTYEEYSYEECSYPIQEIEYRGCLFRVATPDKLIGEALLKAYLRSDRCLAHTY